MKKAVVLGPKGTYSDLAFDDYLKRVNKEYEVFYIPSLLKLSTNLNEDDIAILPVENTLEGIILESLDLIIENNLKIIYELKEKINYAYVGKNPDEVKKVYCQFKSYAQCLNFISKYDFSVIKTDSNTESKKLYLENDEYGAIIPIHLVDNNMNAIFDIGDKHDNETKFAVVSKNASYNEFDSYNISVLVTSVSDRSGILYEILKEFHDYDVNLNSIMSRPLKTKIGKYNFYIECHLNKDELYKIDLIKDNLSNKFIVDIIGIYN